MSSSEFT